MVIPLVIAGVVAGFASIWRRSAAWPLMAVAVVALIWTVDQAKPDPERMVESYASTLIAASISLVVGIAIGGLVAEVARRFQSDRSNVSP